MRVLLLSTKLLSYNQRWNSFFQTVTVAKLLSVSEHLEVDKTRGQTLHQSRRCFVAKITWMLLVL